MSGRDGRKDKRIARTVTFKLRCKEALIPEAMHAAKYTSAESRDPAKQMAVRRAFEKTAGCLKASPLPGSIHSATIQSSLSPLTDDRTPVTDRSLSEKDGGEASGRRYDATIFPHL
jgi:hypothetical protein